MFLIYYPIATHTYYNFYYIYLMIIEIRNRVSIGPVIGFSVYTPDENHDFTEFVLHLLLIEVAFIW